MKSLTFTAVIGISEGYEKLSTIANEAMAIVGLEWQKEATEAFDMGLPFITVTVSPAKVVYSQKWGCPKGGEAVCTVVGTSNPDFVKTEADLDQWKKTAIEITKKVKENLKQSTVFIDFKENLETVYLK